MSRKQSSSAPAASYAIAAATGSPASRKLTKLMPLTTRPSFTSRQGMTRTLNILLCPRGADQFQRFRCIEPAVVKRAAGDCAGKFSCTGRQECAHIVDGGEPARGDDRD